MLQKSQFLLIWIVFLLVFLPACSQKIEGVVATAVPSNTLQPRTAIPLTNTLIPPTPTNEPSGTSTQLPTVAPITLHCEGEGSPAIILNAGCSLNSSEWTREYFFRDLSMITQTCYYTRGRFGRTDTVQDIVDDLHQQTINAQLTPPYVVVGHSCAGWIAIRYAYTYPEEVAGMVLLDSTHPDLASRALQILPTTSPDESVMLSDLRNEFLTWYQPSPQGEQWDFFTSAEQVREVKSLGDIPLLVLTASFYLLSTGDPEINQRLADDWIALHKELAALSTNGRQITVENAGHFMWLDNPSKLIFLIRGLIQQIRSSSP